MRFIIISFLLGIVFSISAQKLDAYYYQSEFWSSEIGEYTEVYFSFVGNSSKFIKNANGKFNSELSVTITYKQNNEIKYFKKYNLKSPEIVSETDGKPNFIDIQRISIKPGKYEFGILIFDKNDTTNTLRYFDFIEIKKHSNNEFSDVEFVEKFTKSDNKNTFNKSGYNIIPYVSDYFPRKMNNFNFYSELYLDSTLISKNEKILIKYYIKPYNSSLKLDKFTKTKLRKTERVNVIIGSFDIASLPTGNYTLNLECINSKNEIVTSKKVFFQRNNGKLNQNIGEIDSLNVDDTFISKVTDIKILEDYIKCLFPLMEAKQILYANNQLRARNVVWMQKFFYGFWLEMAPLEPENEWNKYKVQVDHVNKHFSTQIRRGYETDRGRIYLRYGSPNDIIKRDHPSGYWPYEIWHYVHTRGEGNRKVAFYNPHLGFEYYELLVSNLREEQTNTDWKNQIVRGDDKNNNHIKPENDTMGTSFEEDFRGL